MISWSEILPNRSLIYLFNSGLNTKTFCKYKYHIDHIINNSFNLIYSQISFISFSCSCFITKYRKIWNTEQILHKTYYIKIIIEYFTTYVNEEKNIKEDWLYAKSAVSGMNQSTFCNI